MSSNKLVNKKERLMKAIPFQVIDTEYNGRHISRAALIIQGSYDKITNNVFYQIDTGAPTTHIFSGVFGEVKKGEIKTVYEDVALPVSPMQGIGAHYNQEQINVVGIVGMDFLTNFNGSFGFDFKQNAIIFECESNVWLDYRLIGGHIYLGGVKVNGQLIDNVMYDSGCSAFTIALDCDEPPSSFSEKLTLPGSFGETSDVYLNKGEFKIQFGDVEILFNEIAESSNKYDGMKVAMMGNALLDKMVIFFRNDGKYTVISK